jgi:hypothetical protein
VIVYVKFSSGGAGTIWEGGVFSSFWDRIWAEEEGGGVRSRPGAARTILLFHIISARPSKQPRMVGSTKYSNVGNPLKTGAGAVS